MNFRVAGRTFDIVKLLYIFSAAFLLFQCIRGGTIRGDFGGYVIAGMDAVEGTFIYIYDGNTWPPLFSIFCIPLYLGDVLSSFGVRFLWVFGNFLALYGILELTLQLVLNKGISIREKEGKISLLHPVVYIPLAISFKFILDNFTNLQINIYFLFLCLLCFINFKRGNFMWAGIFLALVISLKVYAIFILLYFVFKREFKSVFWTLAFIVIFNSVSFLYWGYETAMVYYHTWFTQVIDNMDYVDHKNQSIFGLFYRLFTAGNSGHDFYIYFMELPSEMVRKLTYGAVVLLSLYPAFVLRFRLKDRGSIKSILEYGIVFTLIPLLSPMAWKAYFVFLFLPYFLVYVILYHSENALTLLELKWLKRSLILSVLLNVLSSDLFVGKVLSDIFEALSVIFLGSSILAMITFYIAIRGGEIKSSLSNESGLSQK